MFFALLFLSRDPFQDKGIVQPVTPPDGRIASLLLPIFTISPRYPPAACGRRVSSALALKHQQKHSFAVLAKNKNISNKIFLWPSLQKSVCLQPSQEQHLEHGFPVTDPTKIYLLTAIEEKTSRTEFSLLWFLKTPLLARKENSAFALLNFRNIQNMRLLYSPRRFQQQRYRASDFIEGTSRTSLWKRRTFSCFLFHDSAIAPLILRNIRDMRLLYSLRRFQNMRFALFC